MKEVNGCFIPKAKVHSKITSDVAKAYLVAAAQLKKADLESCFEDALEKDKKGIYLAKNWKRIEKKKVDVDLRSILTEILPDLPSEEITARYFRYEAESIDWILGEVYSTKNEILLISIEDQ